jgi:pimeloyl-ACP methyl ester carboxylesterase
MVLSGNGWNMVEPTLDWTPVRDGLLAEDPATIGDAQAIAFRAFADRNGADRRALAACVTGVRQAFSQEQIASIRVPFLIAVGSKDDVGGSPQRLAALNPLAEPFVIEGRDHMKAVGDKSHIAAAIEFLKKG